MCETDLCHKTAKREFHKERIAVTAGEIGVSRNSRNVVLRKKLPKTTRNINIILTVSKYCIASSTSQFTDFSVND